MRARTAFGVALAAFACASAPASARAAGALGAGCGASGDCDSGFCADGVCCDVACDGTCQSCVAAKKQSGLDTGTCGPSRGGTDPRDECAAESRTTCGKTGACAGYQAACALWPQGTPCHDPVDTTCQCQSVSGFVCSGNGVCQQVTNGECAGGDYVCVRDDGQTGSCASAGAGSCASPCSSDADCGNSKTCRAGACVSKLPARAACSTGAECANGACVDGYCCDGACDRQCEACNLPGKEGVCSQVVGPPVGGRPACGGTAPCAGECGAARDQCEYPGAAVECEPASCDHDSSRAAGTCDLAGACAPGAAVDCSPFGCDEATHACLTKCTTSADCSGGAVCDTSTGTGTCNPSGNACDGAYAIKAADGTVTSCDGYACKAGACQASCASAVDCDSAAGYACDGGRCVRAQADAGAVDAADEAPGEPASAPASGGGCSAAGAHAPTFGARLGAFVAAALFVARRRARRRGASV